MPKPIHEMSSWGPSAHPPREAKDWEVTRQLGGSPTQVMPDREDYLAPAARDIGRRIGVGQWEIFVSCDPAEAMRLQFEHLRPEFLALHDVGTATSPRMLAGLASALGTPVQHLVVRRQGQGIALATLEFVEMPAGDGGLPPLRLYTTQTDADTQQRQLMARVLLAHSRLGVVMVGDLPPHALATALRPLQEAIAEGPWPNRQLLMLPLASASTLAQQAGELAQGGDVVVRTTPQVRRPSEAWAFMSGSWNRLRDALADAGTVLPELPALVRPAPARAAPPPSAPLPMRPMPEPARAVRSVEPGSPLATYLQRCSELKGLQSCCLFELDTQRTLAHAGQRPGPAALATQGAVLLAALRHGAQALGLGDAAQPDAAITVAGHHLLLRALPHHEGLALHAVLDRGQANLSLARLQLQRLDGLLEPGSAD